MLSALIRCQTTLAASKVKTWILLDRSYVTWKQDKSIYNQFHQPLATRGAGDRHGNYSTNADG
jgi:hypothetical protein